ncbi:amidohydrolase family-domain-containing protein [Exophiala viscosa]|uniref:Amidohydrolase family-domain-containing protein n=1 Tax=Exophiala viscosa TaxID=2486360 RepID=A0AAN6IHX1_9EURO|nr:amidohydrolase family-domain-containing protein [Exophiala viscosa]
MYSLGLMKFVIIAFIASVEGNNQVHIFARRIMTTLTVSRGHSGEKESKTLLKATTVITGGSVYTMNDLFDWYPDGAVAMRHGTIIWVGNSAGLRDHVNLEGASTVNTRGHPIMPGLIDSHMHPLLAGIAVLSCVLDSNSVKLADLQSKILACLEPETTSKDEILTVVNWDRPGFNSVNGHDATYRDLEGLSSRPIQLKASDGHSTLVNESLLRLLNITATSLNPPGGKYAKDASGQPTGILEDSAGYQVLKLVKPSIETLTTAASIAQSVINSHGVTSVVDAAVTSQLQVPAYSALYDAGNLTSRYFGSFVIFDPDLQELKTVLSNFSQLRTTHETGPLNAAPGINLGGIKFYMDGVITYPTSSGAVLEPYLLPDPKNASHWIPANSTIAPFSSGSNLTEFLDIVMENNFTVHLHADGDAAVRTLLDSIEALPYDLEDNRIAVAHAELVDPIDYHRFRELNIRLIMQYQWAQDSTSYHAINGTKDTSHSLGPVRMGYLQPYGNLTSMGNNVIYGSDFPVEPLDPFLALQIAVTRMGSLTDKNSAASQNPIFYRPINDQGPLSRIIAMRGFTTYGAQWLNASSQIGSLEVGKFADLIVTQHDFFDLSVPNESIADNAVLMTMVGGQVVYAADSNISNSSSQNRQSGRDFPVPQALWSATAFEQQHSWRRRDPEKELMRFGGLREGCGLHLHKH